MPHVISETHNGKHGVEILHDPGLNKSTAFTEAERQAVGLVGLLPDTTESIETQLTRVLLQLKSKATDLELLCLPVTATRYRVTTTTSRVRQALCSPGLSTHSRSQEASSRTSGFSFSALAPPLSASPTSLSPIWVSKASSPIWRGNKSACSTARVSVAGRPGLAAHKLPYAHKLPPGKPFNHLDLASEYPQIVAAIEAFKPTALIGVSKVGNCFRGRSSKRWQATMRARSSSLFPTPSRSTSVCPRMPTAGQAARWCMQEACSLDGHTYLPSQANNLYIFPAVGMAIYATNAKRVADEMFIEAAHAVADQVTPAQLKLGMLFPPQSNILEIETYTAARVAELIFKRDLARVPRPKDIHAFIESQVYRPHYPDSASVEATPKTEIRRAA